MAVTITPGPGVQQVTVEVGQQLKSLGTKTTLLTGAEEAICEHPGGEPSQVMGYVDLTNLISGDIVIIRFYVRVRDGGPWGLCYEESYSGPLPSPIVHIAKRPENHGLKITIQQTAGSPKVIDYEFFEEA